MNTYIHTYRETDSDTGWQHIHTPIQTDRKTDMTDIHTHIHTYRYIQSGRRLQSHKTHTGR